MGSVRLHASRMKMARHGKGGGVASALLALLHMAYNASARSAERVPSKNFGPGVLVYGR